VDFSTVIFDFLTLNWVKHKSSSVFMGCCTEW